MNCEQKFVFLLQSNNIYINKLVAVFVYYSFHYCACIMVKHQSVLIIHAEGRRVWE